MGFGPYTSSVRSTVASGPKSSLPNTRLDPSAVEHYDLVVLVYRHVSRRGDEVVRVLGTLCNFLYPCTVAEFNHRQVGLFAVEPRSDMRILGRSKAG